MRWEIGAGLGALVVVAIVGVLIAASTNGVWLVAFLPLAATIGGAVLIAGREQI